MSSSLDGRLARPFLLAITIWLVLLAHPAQADCASSTTAQSHCEGLGDVAVPLALDGRLSDLAALPPPVSSPVLDATLAQLRSEQTAIAMRMRLLELQALPPASAYARPHGVPRGQTAAQRLMPRSPDAPAPLSLPDRARGWIAALLSMVVACGFGLFLKKCRRGTAVREPSESEKKPVRPMPSPALPEPTRRSTSTSAPIPIRVTGWR
ncbi:hypothetical protein [Silvimonas amylolytica]|uniref:hypothetical protein n=1 Tax=Silvimonas amylolytica TaxID=449663 RepID=UPI00166BB51C|nr:hypothetical protein [Silvimonas amylolytica]